MADDIPRVWLYSARVLWSFVLLLLWSALTTALGRLVLREVLEDQVTIKNLDDSPLAVALVHGSAFVSIPLAAIHSDPGLTPLCALGASTFVPSAGIISHSLLHAARPAVRAFADVALTPFCAWFTSVFLPFAPPVGILSGVQSLLPVAGPTANVLEGFKMASAGLIALTLALSILILFASFMAICIDD